ncbi:MAG TPA: hypothetical protein VFM79_08125, partial [Pelobium sp.]|nr:hypothetical protein [Pelobium sp.]
MKKVNLLLSGILTTSLIFGLSSCKKDNVTPEKGRYVLAVTAEGSSSEATDYILQTEDLMSGVISPAGQGIEQKSYR